MAEPAILGKPEQLEGIETWDSLRGYCSLSDRACLVDVPVRSVGGLHVLASACDVMLLLRIRHEVSRVCS